MADANFLLFDETRPLPLPVRMSGTQFRVAPGALRDALGWELKPQGLCKGEVCVPVKDQPGLVTDKGIDLAGFAAALRRPLAIDVDERMACLGVAAADRAAQMTSLTAPDFRLPDWQGRQHSLSEYLGKKILLVAYASW